MLDMRNGLLVSARWAGVAVGGVPHQDRAVRTARLRTFVEWVEIHAVSVGGHGVERLDFSTAAGLASLASSDDHRRMTTGNASVPAATLRSPHQLTPSQAAVLSWIVEGCPDGVYPEDSFAHRISARALVSRGLVNVSGHGQSWQAVPTESGRVWPGLTDSDAAELERANQHVGAVAGRPSPAKSAATVSQYLSRRPAPAKPVPITHINKQETYMRFKVIVTRVQVAERWIRGVDEEDAARKVREEFEKPYAYFGHWETKASEIEIVEVEQTTVIPPNLLDESGPMLLTIKDAAEALGIPHRALGLLASQGDVECTRIGTRKYVSREALLAFIRVNTHRGFAPN